MSNPSAREWFRDKLQALQQLGVAGFKVDGGDFKYQPAPEIAAWYAPQQPSGYSDALLALLQGDCAVML